MYSTPFVSTNLSRDAVPTRLQPLPVRTDEIEIKPILKKPKLNDEKKKNKTIK
jgi:hypothetical protein